MHMAASASFLPASDPSGALARLSAEAQARSLAQGAYGGEVSPAEAWDFLCKQGGALVDVRTPPEWTFVGEPDVKESRGELMKIAWKTYPAFTVNPQFSEQLRASGAREDMPLFFICRTGGRSLDAAIAMQAEGFQACFNVTGGFEGEPNANGHRGTVNGWKASGLPWRQA